MRYLLDTQVFIWFLDDYGKIPMKVDYVLNNNENIFYICSVSLWEIVIKSKKNKLKLSFDIKSLYQCIHVNNIIIINIEQHHLHTYQMIDFFHKDPFDRLIISTAMAENIPLITSDKIIHKYDIKYIW